MQEIELKTSHETLLIENQKLISEIAYLKQELANLKKLIFGSKSERFIPSDSNQLDFGLDGTTKPAPTEPETETISYQRRKKSEKNKPSRNALPAHLPREIKTIEPDEDTTGLKKIGEEITEELEYTPGTLHVNRYVRPKYARPNGACPEPGRRDGVLIGMLPNRPIEKGIPGPGLLAHVLISKFVDHLPVYRQAQMLKRQGVEIARSTMGDWVKYSCEALAPVHELLREKVLSTAYLMADETPIRVLDYKSKKKTHLGYFWVYYDPVNKRVLFDYRSGRGRAGPVECLKNFKGLLQNDGYQAYEHFEERKDITLLACWAHARRYFDKAQNNDPERAQYALTEIRNLYAIESYAREHKLSHADRKKLRQEKALPVLENLETWLRENHLTTLPESAIGKAISYALKRWDKLTQYTEFGQVEIDNNLVENAIRPVALGRKNYLFAGSHAGAERAALIYSLVVTAKLHGIEPFAWLRDTLSKIADHPHKRLAELLPE